MRNLRAAMNGEGKVRCGVAGVGYLGEHHGRVYRNLDRCDLVGVFDIDRERAVSIAGKFSCRVFDSLEALGEACDAVSVVVPTDQHCAAAQSLLAANCHLLIEKPICTTLDEAELILNSATEANRIVQVGHIEHYNPVMGFLEEAVAGPVYITADRLAPFNPRGTEVGVVLDLMIHDIGIILELVRSPLKSIQSVGVNVLSLSEDIANARLEFENGCVANVNTSRVSLKKVREIRVFQANTYLSLDFMDQKGHLLRKDGERLVREDIPIEQDEPLTVELASFVECVAQNRAPKVGGAFGRSALEVAIRITDQVANHQRRIAGGPTIASSGSALS